MSCPIAALPDELMLAVFSFLDANDVAVRSVCHHWKALADDPQNGRHMTAVVSTDRVPVVSPGLGAVVYTRECTQATLAAVVARYRQLRSLVAWHRRLDDGDDIVDPPDTLTFVELGEDVRDDFRTTPKLLPLTNHVTTLFISCTGKDFLRLRNVDAIRGITAIVYPDDDDDMDELAAVVASMTSLRFLQLYISTHDGNVAMGVPTGLDHLQCFPACTTAALSNVVSMVAERHGDASRVPSLRVLSTRRQPDGDVMKRLHSLILRNVLTDVATLTDLCFLSTHVPVQVGTLYATLANLPHLLGLALPTCGLPPWWMFAPDDHVVVLPRLRRFSISERILSSFTLLSLPAIEVVFVARDCGSRDVFCAADRQRRTPWSADERDALLRTCALDNGFDLLLSDEHDAARQADRRRRLRRARQRPALLAPRRP
jgi:hypothetical protein